MKGNGKREMVEVWRQWPNPTTSAVLPFENKVKKKHKRGGKGGK